VRGEFEKLADDTRGARKFDRIRIPSGEEISGPRACVACANAAELEMKETRRPQALKTAARIIIC
jgi:hypothetical protein